MNYHVLLQDLGPTVVVILFVIVGFAAWGQFKRQTVSDLQQAIQISKDLADVAKQQSHTQKGQIATLKAAQDMQEKRILRLEIDNARKSRRLLARDHETDMLENIVRVAVSGLKPTDPCRVQVDDLLAELAKFRRRTQDQMDEWEQTQTAMHSYLGSDAANILDKDD